MINYLIVNSSCNDDYPNNTLVILCVDKFLEGGARFSFKGGLSGRMT